MNIVLNILERCGIHASLPQVDDFEKWLVGKLWEKYTDEKMNKIKFFENKIKSVCKLQVPNGTVGKDYNAQIELPTELVEDAWFEKDIETLGLTLDTFDPEESKSAVDDEAVPDNTKVLETKNESLEKDIPVAHPTKLILKIMGKPKVSGDHTISLRYKHKGWLEGEPISEIPIRIAFNPDPRTLWKTIPTREDIHFYKKDSDCEYVKVDSKEGTDPRKDIVVASQRGRSHAQEGKPRDDHFVIKHCDESDWYIIAVADGAGSAKFSRRGSEIACNTVVAHCLEQLRHNEEFESKIRAYNEAKDDAVAKRNIGNSIYTIVGNGAFKAYSAIKEEAMNNGGRIKDFATTLMFAICKKFDFGWFVASYWVGDGAMCLYNREKHTHKILGVPDEGEFSGQTRFLTMPEIFKDAKSVMDRLRFSIEEDFTALMLMTDGVSDPMFETDNNLQSIEKWDEFWDKLKNGFEEDEIPGVELTDDNEKSKEQLLRWLDFWSPGNHDDRTMAILY